jgi:hypothetical protein
MSANTELRTAISDAIVAHLEATVIPSVTTALENAGLSESEITIELNKSRAYFTEAGESHAEITDAIIDVVEARLEVSLKAWADDLMAYVTDLESALTTWTPVPNDGGDALKTLITARTVKTVPTATSNQVIFNDA